MKLLLALGAISFSFFVDLTEYKIPLYTISAIATLLTVYNSNKEFKYLEYIFITFINTFIKGFVLEMYLHNKHSLLDYKTIKLGIIVFLITLTIGNPYILKWFSLYIDSNQKLKFSISIIDKLAQSILFSSCYHHIFSQLNSSVWELLIVTIVACFISFFVIFLGLLETKDGQQAFRILKTGATDNLILYSSCFIIIQLWYNYIQNLIPFQFDELKAIRIIICTTFVCLYSINQQYIIIAILSIQHSKHKPKSH